MIVSESRDAGAHRAVLVLEYADRLDRLHHVRRRDRLARARRIVDPIDRREFALLALVSIPLWLVFEFYNLFIDNWYYVGLPGEHRCCDTSATPGRSRRSGRRSSKARS